MFSHFYSALFLMYKTSLEKKMFSGSVLGIWSAVSMTVPLEVVECNSDVFNFKDIN